ncbi:MAG: glycosyl hydrolase family 18 protein [Bacteroidota bacterium]
MLKNITFLFFSLFVFNTILAQVGINTNAPQSALDIQSDTLGLTIPRVSQIQGHVRSIGGSQPAMGTIVFNKLDSCFYGFDGELWYKFQFASPGFGPENSPPTISSISLNGSLYHGNTVSSSYNFFDADGDIEGATVYKWYYKSGNAYILDVTNASGNSFTIDTTSTHSIGDSIKVEITPVAVSGESPGQTVSKVLGAIGNTPSGNGPDGPVVLTYFPSWSESYPSQNITKLRQMPLHVTHIFLAFAKPNLTYEAESFDISDTGIEVPYDGCELARSISILHEKGIKVILSVGGETYWGSPQAYNINYQMIKDLVDDLGFDGIDWDYEPNGSFADIGSETNVNHFITFFEESRAIMPAGEYILACAPSGVGCLGGMLNNDPSSPFAFENRNTLSGEDDTNLYNATAPNEAISLFGFGSTGHMIPVIAAVGDLIDLIAIQNYNVGAANNRSIMYDSYAYYADTYSFEIVAGTHFPDEPWGPHFEYTPTVVADLAEHISTSNSSSGRKDGLFIWQALLSNATLSAYGYMNVASQVLNGTNKATAIAQGESWSYDTYTGSFEDPCNGQGGQTYCGESEYDASQNYPGGNSVHYNCHIWTTNYWANPGEHPGQINGQWMMGAACDEAEGCD